MAKSFALCVIVLGCSSVQSPPSAPAACEPVSECESNYSTMRGYNPAGCTSRERLSGLVRPLLDPEHPESGPMMDPEACERFKASGRYDSGLQ